MKVAILTRDYPPAIGGIATHVEGLVKALRRMGVEADLYVGTNDVKTLLLPFDIPLKEYDLVHVQSLPYGAFVFGVPLVVTVHSPVLEEFAHYRSALKLASIPAIALEKVSLWRAGAVLAVSGQSRSELVGMYGLPPGRVDVIGNGVDYERFSGRRDATSPSATKRVLVVSRLEPRKNVREAIEAVAELPKGSCRLEIAGDGSERAALVDLTKRVGAESEVHFLGRVDAASLPEVYADSAIFLTTSNSEGFGLSLLEAMACLAKGTLVQTSYGPKRIQDIRPGTMVLTHRGRYKPVLKIAKGVRGGTMYAIETTHGRLIASPDHMLLTSSGWSSASTLHKDFCVDYPGAMLHCRLLRRRGTLYSRDWKAEQELTTLGDGPGGPPTNRSRPEHQTPKCTFLDTGEDRGANQLRTGETRGEVAYRRQNFSWSTIGGTPSIPHLQERRGPHSARCLPEATLFRPQLARGLDMVHRQSYSTSHDSFGVQPYPAEPLSGAFEWVEIGSVEPIQFFGEIFDLVVADDNSYFANDLTVHNSGCACIASDLPTHRALIEHGVSGMIYRDRAELVSSLRELLSSPEKIERLGAAARRVASDHSWEKVAERVMIAYEGAVRDSERRGQLPG